MTDTVWGPYWETYDPNTDQYLLFKRPNPAPIARSKVPLLRKHVSILLNELLKPQSILGTPVPGFDRGPNEAAKDSVINAAIATIDEKVLRKVEAASNNEEALAVLALEEDPRFGDLSEPGCEPLRDKLLSYIYAYIHENAIHGVKSKKKTESDEARKARANWLDARMKENGWTVNKLAGNTGVSYMTIKGILKAKNCYSSTLDNLREAHFDGKQPLKDLP